MSFLEPLLLIELLVLGTFTGFAAGLLGIGHDAVTTLRDALLRAHGRAVDSLRGAYITAPDVGLTPADLDVIALEDVAPDLPRLMKPFLEAELATSLTNLAVPSQLSR